MQALFKGPVGLSQVGWVGLTVQYSVQPRQRFSNAEQLSHGLTWEGGVDLLQPTDATVPGDASTDGFDPTRYQLEQGRFAHAVTTDNAGALTPNR